MRAPQSSAFPICCTARRERSARYAAVSDGFMAGAVAGALAEAIVHPLDTISTRLKLQSQPPYKYAGLRDCARVVLKEEGVRGLYAGVGAALLSALPTNAVYFATYEAVRAAALDDCDGSGWGAVAGASAVYAVAGAASELTSSLVYVPFEVVKVRLQTGRPVNAVYGSESQTKLRSPALYRGPLHGFAQIVRTEGPRGLYAGWGACILTDCCYSALLFVAYEELKRREVPPILAGTFAGGIAGVLSNPFEVVTTRQMIAGSTAGRTGAGTRLRALDVARTLHREEGWRGLWKGGGARAASHAPNAAIMFAAYESVCALLERWHGRAIERDLGAW